eukprot:3002937-Pleurochrysis_carterae.AAC.1
MHGTRQAQHNATGKRLVSARFRQYGIVGHAVFAFCGPHCVCSSPPSSQRVSRLHCDCIMRASASACAAVPGGCAFAS